MMIVDVNHMLPLHTTAIYDISLMTMFCRQFQTAFVVEMPEVLHHFLSPIRRTKFLLHGQDGWIGEDVVGIIATAL